MHINKLKVMLSIMLEVNRGKAPKIKNYPLSDSEVYDIIQLCQDELLIKGFYVKRKTSGDVELVDIHSMRVTLKGLEFLNKYSELLKSYKSGKELKEWLQY
ncbi:MAG: hypothetical protein IJW47_02575 [Clostridia bacterium]|nr:hypothetical protein [Clostridia bacterium]